MKLLVMIVRNWSTEGREVRRKGTGEKEDKRPEDRERS
jgi:hypothetical protein